MRSRCATSYGGHLADVDTRKRRRTFFDRYTYILPTQPLLPGGKPAAQRYTDVVCRGVHRVTSECEKPGSPAQAADQAVQHGQVQMLR